MVRILSATPIHVDEEELARRRARYEALTPPGSEFRLVDAGTDAPEQLDSAAAVEASQQAVRSALAGHDGHWDYRMPDCVLDPAVPVDPGSEGSAELTGMLRTVAEHLVAGGHRIGAVTRNAAIAEELRARLTAYGLGEAFVGVVQLDLDLADVAEGGRWNSALGSALEQLGARGATAVINGCSAVEIEREDEGPALIDPAATAVRLLATGSAR